FEDSMRFRFLKAILIIMICDGACLLMLPALFHLKYAVFLAIFLIAAGTFWRHLSLTVFPAFPLGFLALSVISLVTFAALQNEGGGISYTSALFPMMLVGLSAFIPEDRSHLNFESALDFYQKISVLFVIVHVSWQILFLFSPFAEKGWYDMANHESLFFAAFGICLSLLLGRWRNTGILAGLVVISLLIRPTSTFIAALAIGLVITLGFLLNRQAIAMLFGNAVLVLLMLFPLAFVAQPKVVEFTYGIEPMVKEELLGSASNNSFRIAVLGLAREAILKTPWATGQGFSGTPNVDVGTVNEGWSGGDPNDPLSSRVPIHSDFVIMLWQGGMLGYGLFALSFTAVVVNLRRSLEIAVAKGAVAAVTLLRSLYIFIVVFSVYISFNPILQKYSFSYLFWFSLLILTLACRQTRSWQRQKQAHSLPSGRSHNG
ncbi:MAG: hypothetical protein ACREBC_25910, partial [Pyrinomonadaceae bacterium]